MDESDPNESSNETTDSSNVTNDDSNGRNQSDNKLAQYMLINKELSKTMAVLRAENAKLRTNNKELNLENLTYRNELTGNRNEITKWRRKFAKLQTMHIQHVEMLTSELQSYADKLTGVFGSDDEEVETEVTVRVTEQLSITTANSSSIGEDPDDASPRVNKSLESSIQPDIKLPDMLDENPSSLNTISEEMEGDIEASNSEQISLITSTHESTLTDETEATTEAVDDGLDGTKTITFRKSVSDSCEMASMDSNKENARPSTFVNSNLTLASEDSSLTVRANETVSQTNKKSDAPLKEKFITQRRTRKRTNEQNSFESAKSPELVSSTPYKRKRSESNIKSTTPPVRTSDSSRTTRRTTMSTSTSGRPKRNVCPVNFVEPKLNTKMRRPRT